LKKRAQEAGPLADFSTIETAIGERARRLHDGAAGPLADGALEPLQ